MFIATTVSRSALFALAMLTMLASAAMAQPTQPNIIYILADDLGYGDLGCYGQKRIATPNIDRLAAEGMRFTDHYAGSTVCAPSRSVLMTGLHTGHTYVRGNDRVPLRPSDVTVAEILKEAGYRTAIFGKWGLGLAETTGVPNRQGFDEWFGYLDQHRAHNYYPDYLWENEKKFILEGNEIEPWKNTFITVKKTQYSHDLFAERALEFIEGAHDKPFFLYLPWTIPHANNELGRKLTEEHEGEGPFAGNGMEVPSDEPYSDRDWPAPQRNHAAMITRLDGDVGRIMSALKTSGLDENTLVIFTSDNGPHREGGAIPEFFGSSGPLRGIKRDLYEGGIRVPMIARWPGKIAEGATSDHVSAFWDVMPTFAELAGAEPPEGIDGISFAPTLLNRGYQRPHEQLYWEFHERGFKQAVRMGKWKMVVLHNRDGSDRKVELYDLDKDLGETLDLADEHQDIVARAEAVLVAERIDSEFWPWPRTTDE